MLLILGMLVSEQAVQDQVQLTVALLIACHGEIYDPFPFSPTNEKRKRLIWSEIAIKKNVI